MKETCIHCKKEFNMGYTGTIHGCDKCTGAVRNEDGYVFMPDEKKISVIDFKSGKLERLMRPKETT